MVLKGRVASWCRVVAVVIISFLLLFVTLASGFSVQPQRSSLRRSMLLSPSIRLKGTRTTLFRQTCTRIMSLSSTRASAEKELPLIAIIGSGAAGLAAARVLSRSGKASVTVLEKEEYVGGIWKYRGSSNDSVIDDGSKDTPMYLNLRTNLPKEIMAYRELPWPDYRGDELLPSFCTHAQVLDYLELYKQHFALEPLIQYGCTVTHVSTTNEASKCSPLTERWPALQVEWKQSDKDTPSCAVFDAVIVSNGHYARPNIPNLPGMEYFRGETMHSRSYDTPKAFAGKTVLCMGGRASGADLAREISATAKHVYLSDSTQSTVCCQGNITWTPKTVGVLPDGRIQFERDDSHSVNPKVDVILYCTGYDYDFMFLQDSDIELDSQNRRVQPLVEQLWHADVPNLAFAGLPHSVVPFPLFELQAEACHEQWLVKSTLPDHETRRTLAAADANSGGWGKSNGRVPEDTHYLGPAQWDYMRKLAYEYAGIPPKSLDAFISTSQEIYDHSHGERKGDFPGGPDAYRETKYRRNYDDHSYTVVYSELSDCTKEDAVSVTAH